MDDLNHTDSLTIAERLTLQQLRNHPNIIIKPADKGSKIVILDKQHQYLERYDLYNIMFCQHCTVIVTYLNVASLLNTFFFLPRP